MARVIREPVIGLRAAPHTSVLRRLATLRATIGLGLSGRDGNVVGADRGDPTMTWTGPTEGRVTPTAALNQVTAGASAFRTPTPIVQNSLGADVTLDPYNALLLARMKQQ